MSDSDDAGPEPLLPAGTEAPAWVGDLLASLRTDDPPLPDDVAERIDRALAVLTTADVLPAEPEPSPVADLPGATGDAGDDGDDRADAGATVVPLAARDRRSGSKNPWGHRLLLGGVAASAALVLGGLGTVAVIRNSGGPPTESSITADSGELGAVADRVRYVASNQDYTADTVATTADAVLAASTTPLDPDLLGTPSLAPSQYSTTGAEPPTGGSPPPTSADPSVSPTAVPPAVVLRAATTRPADSCVDQLAGAEDVDPLLVDEATYERQPAFVVVIATSGDAGSADVWVVARTCTAGNEGVLAFARIAR